MIREPLSLTAAMSNTVRFHLSLNVSDLAKVGGFYRALFGMEPAKLRADYAKFEPDDPPLVLSLEPASASAGGALNHLGFRLPDAKSLVAMQERLERAGIRTSARRGSSAATRGRRSSGLTTRTGRCGRCTRSTGTSIIAALGSRRSVDTRRKLVHSRAGGVGTPHERSDCPIASRWPTARPTRVRAARHVQPAARGRKAARRSWPKRSRACSRAGECSSTSWSASGRWKTPICRGRRRRCGRCHVRGRPRGMLEDAGLVGVRMLKFDAKPCFVRNGVGMRELQLEGFAPAIAEGLELEVMYKGPFREVRDDGGRVFAAGPACRGTRQHRSAVPNGRMGQPVHHLRISLDAAPCPSPPAVAREAISLLTPASPAHRDHPRPG